MVRSASEPWYRTGRMGLLEGFWNTNDADPRSASRRYLSSHVRLVTRYPRLYHNLASPIPPWNQIERDKVRLTRTHRIETRRSDPQLVYLSSSRRQTCDIV